MTRGGRHPPMLRARLPFLLAERLFTYLDGIDARDWWRLLRENRFAVDPVYWPRAARVSYASARTSAYRASEDQKYGRAVAGTEIQPPLFVLGHARSGTSYLHRLLAMDDRFAYPNQYQTNHPHTFLTTETRHADRMAAALLGTRVADNMAGGVTLPAEDEFALSLLTRCSPLLGWTFPRHWDRYLPYLTFRGVPDDELRRWKAALTWFLKKLSWKYRRPLVLKSPYHTARIRLLLETFPEARFVHIHRHPYTVFQSNHLMRTRLRHFNHLQCEVRENIEDRILRLYADVYDTFFEERPIIPPGRFCEVRFQDLERDPIGQVREIYRNLSIPWPACLELKVGLYADSVAGYRKNAHPPLAPSVRARVAEAWRRSFEEWGYRA
jgi:hypothetical protein